MKLEEIRERIVAIDSKIMELLNERMELAVRTKRLKTDVLDLEREKAVLKRIEEKTRQLVSKDFSRELYSIILSESKALQQKGYSLTGFQGAHGANDEAALTEFDPDFIPIPCAEYEDVFNGVESGSLDFGVVPTENAADGMVTAANELLIKSGCHVVGEVTIPLSHSLLALPGCGENDIRIVYSHPRILAQCDMYIKEKGLEARTWQDSAGAAKMLSNMQLKTAGVIANETCSGLYNLSIIRRDVDNSENNFTRYFILSKHNTEAPAGNKATIVISLENKPGELAKTLEFFSANGLNLTRIESHPISGNPGCYDFLIDLTDAKGAENLMETVRGIKDIAVGYKFLGCYKGQKDENRNNRPG